jgi:hypothetical protein
MASLGWYQKKFGKRAGRKKYNAYHQAYRNTRKLKLRAYFKAYRVRKTASKLSTGG